jgi:hypothetical protein
MSGSIPWIHPQDNATDSLWDQLRLGGIQWPGLWMLSVTKKRSLDIVKVRRKDGTMTLDNGYFGCEMKATGSLWTQDQFDELQAILPYFDPQRRGGGRTPLDIYHPAAALLAVHQCYIGLIEVPPVQGGRLSFGFDIVEWCADLKPFIQGFAGAQKANTPVNARDFSVDSPANNTGDKL